MKKLPEYVKTFIFISTMTVAVVFLILGVLFGFYKVVVT
jgi:hypothetical protein